MAQKIIKYKKQELDNFYTKGKDMAFWRLYNRYDKEIGLIDDNEFSKIKEMITDKQMALLYVRDDNETIKRFANFMVQNFKDELVLIPKEQ